MPSASNQQFSPDAVQIAEVELLPEAAAKSVADPAGNGQHPQANGGPSQAQHTLVRTAAKVEKTRSHQ